MKKWSEDSGLQISINWSKSLKLRFSLVCKQLPYCEYWQKKPSNTQTRPSEGLCSFKHENQCAGLTVNPGELYEETLVEDRQYSVWLLPLVRPLDCFYCCS